MARKKAKVLPMFRESWEAVGGLSLPSKMPGYGYSIPASMCNTGGKLRTIKGSTCNGCYAFRGNYCMPTVQKAMFRRFRAISDPNWVSNMVTLIKGMVTTEFRWHDSGDIQSVDHLSKIVEIARQTPHIRHWLPTREYMFVRQFVDRGGTIPENLTIRLSAHFMNTTKWPKIEGTVVSSVHTNGNAPLDAHICPARKQGNKCGECRACWDPNVSHVSYPKH